MIRFIIASLVFAVFSAPSITAAKGAEDVEACRRIAQGAVEAARLREQGVAKDDALSRLGARVGSGAPTAVDIAYSHPGLREFPLEDFAQVYCMTSKTEPWLRDFDLVMLKARLDISTQCAEQGHLDRKSFVDCVNRASRPAR